MIYELAGVRPEIHETAWIAPDANVIGRVTVGPGASIWFGTTIRGDNEAIVIGEESNVQENCVLHTDPGAPLTIGARCTIGHKAMLHGCTVGDGSLVGMCATMLNGSVLGEGALLGAGALLTEGKTIPPGHLALGSPARAARELTEEARAGLLASAEHYAQNARRFAAALRPL